MFLKDCVDSAMDELAASGELDRIMDVPALPAFTVKDCELNRAWYPDLIGRTFVDPPGYAVVEPVRWAA